MVIKLVCAVSVLMVLHGLTEVAGRRCSEMLKDEPCTIEGSLPLTLRCDRKTGEFFKIQSLSVEYHPGIWTKVPAARAMVSDQCRKSRRLDKKSLEYYCEITDTDLCPFADRMRNVKLTYYCWELDPELLQGFVQPGETKNPWPDRDGFIE